MDYISTRGSAPALDFEQATLAGLAADGGLYVPRAWPQWTAADFEALRGLGYAETAVRVMTPFVGDALSEDELRALCSEAYNSFSHAAVTPLVQLDGRHWLLELFHGPTLAFKDVALQMLGGLFETFLARSGKALTIVGATSGDTGSAAIQALAGRERIEIFMLHPHGRITDVQRRQMTTIHAPNVHNIAIEGSFDDAQAMVKRIFGDESMREKFAISAVNSINWARLMAQIVYYVWAAVQLGAPQRRVAFSVPTGNFGDAFAGYAAAQMGLPVERIIVATNSNDIMHRAFATGDYSKGEVRATGAPSMDIQVASNFERLLFDMEGRDGAKTAARMADFDGSGKMVLAREMLDRAALFASARADADDMSLAMRWAQERCGELIDPHTAAGLHAARAADLPENVPIVTLATAHPAKFRETVERATGVRPALPSRVGHLFDREERFDVLPADYATVKAFIAERAAPSA
ncbi:threonine synthase [Novosphingopyxis sp.]|uniref:threonine synthase n=1 Tax=Novosphingopyxis sp. TaxID=2709690 RepID=UPI003B5A7237